MDRVKKLRLNTISALGFQLVTFICGFVLPRLILSNYGTNVNGLVNSITQFLHIIAFLELGVGSVVQASLYGPLSEQDYNETSKIIASANNFFRKIAFILLGYIVFLVIIFPSFVNNEFSFIFTSTLIIVIGISFFSQYYFGVVDRLLLTADQKGYIQYIAQSVTLILNTLACVLFIKLNLSIHVIKLTTSIIFLFRPIFLRIYVNKNYTINRQIDYTEEPIKQKWNGIAQHIASVILDQTDIVVLTVFSTLENVSIYSVYYLVILGIKSIFLSMTNGIQSLMGELIAKNEIEKLKELFDWTEWVLHTGTTIIFGCTAVLIIPFVQVYTKGVNDANYIIPAFAYLLTLANAGHCLRLPYNIVILASGRFKETQVNYIIASFLNIIISVLTVKHLGLIGVAIGTFIAMFYQTIWMASYDCKNILKIPLYGFFKHIIIDTLVIGISYILTYNLSLNKLSYISWFNLSIKVFLIWVFVSTIINAIFYRQKSK